jgi:hypothetical protein
LTEPPSPLRRRKGRDETKERIKDGFNKGLGIRLREQRGINQRKWC